MRGKAQAEQVRRFLNGITPAYAGKSVSRLLRKASLWDHPRVCGEKSAVEMCSSWMYGSPPRMRGKVDKHDPKRGQHRITPAYAGKSLYVGLNFAQTEGSPPRMRGKVIKCTWGWYVPMDHPRVCGEKVCFSFRPTAFLGSPPRMRGKVGWSLSRSRRSGITPAYAGKSFKAQILITPLKDHPRVCGEKDFTPSPADFALGSPPRMRGKVRRERGPMRSRRITPAYAGKRHNGKKKAIPGQDHPRVCGEKPCPGC